MVYGRYNELVFMGIIMVYNQQTSLGGPILYKQLEKIERYSGSIAGWFFFEDAPQRDRQQKSAREQHTFKRGSDVTKTNKKMGVQCGGPPGDVNDGFYNPMNTIVIRYHKP